MRVINFYTDGSASTIYHTGGWGIFVQEGDKEEFFYGSAEETTNNAMELTAFLKALHFIEATGLEGCEINIYSDSAYLTNCFFQKWYEKWQANGWKAANKQPVKHIDIWKEILEKINVLKTKNDITIHKVAAHQENYGNNFADKLAVRAREELEAECGY